jgi:hypothetical protein
VILRCHSDGDFELTSARSLHSVGARYDFTMMEKGPRGCSKVTGMGGAVALLSGQRGTVDGGNGVTPTFCDNKFFAKLQVH